MKYEIFQIKTFRLKLKVSQNDPGILKDIIANIDFYGNSGFFK